MRLGLHSPACFGKLGSVNLIKVVRLAAKVAVEQMKGVQMDILKHTLCHGGGTFHVDGVPTPDTARVGYYVGVGSVAVVPASAPSAAVAAINRGIEQARAHGALLGTWIDRDTGQLYVDISGWYPNLDTALVVARRRGELAVWDVANSAEIRV